MDLNIASLKTQLAAKIAAIDTLTDINDILLLSTSVANITTDRIITVNTTNDLPDLQTGLNTFSLPPGSIFYVRSLQILVISSRYRWIGFDGRVLRNDASTAIAYCWGSNGSGQLGDGTITTRSSPVTVVGGITNWIQVDIADNHSLGVTTAGIAYAWGFNGSGNLGTGNTTSSRSPITVIGGITNWSQVSANETHSLGLTSTGIAYGWGNNSYGRLGDGTTTNRSSPVTVVGGITNWSQISAGRFHCLGLTATGIAYAWGNALHGRLGDGTTVSKSSPVTVVGGITNWSQVSAGGSHSLGITTTGIAYGWGYNNGSIGDGTTVSKSSPVTVVGGITNWSQVSAGRYHSLGLTSTGIAYAWGFNGYGRLGDGTAAGKSSPVTVVGGITNWSQVSAGGGHSLGLTATGITYAWGGNSNGQLGDNTTTSKSSPVSVVGGISNWVQVSAGKPGQISSAGLTSSG